MRQSLFAPQSSVDNSAGLVPADAAVQASRLVPYAFAIGGAALIVALIALIVALIGL
jgi:hypothetical protein